MRRDDRTATRSPLPTLLNRARGRGAVVLALKKRSWWRVLDGWCQRAARHESFVACIGEKTQRGERDDGLASGQEETKLYLWDAEFVDFCCAFKGNKPYTELELVLLRGYPLFLIARVTSGVANGVLRIDFKN